MMDRKNKKLLKYGLIGFCLLIFNILVIVAIIKVLLPAPQAPSTGYGQQVKDTGLIPNVTRTKPGLTYTRPMKPANTFPITIICQALVNQGCEVQIKDITTGKTRILPRKAIMKEVEDGYGEVKWVLSKNKVDIWEAVARSYQGDTVAGSSNINTIN